MKVKKRKQHIQSKNHTLENNKALGLNISEVLSMDWFIPRLGNG